MKAISAKKRAPGFGASVRRLLLVLCTTGVVAACGARGRAQQPALTQGLPPDPSLGYPLPGGPFANSGDEVDAVQAERRLNALNAERQKSLTADAGKLLKLATELNREVAQSNPGTLTPEQLRMVAEIEKLAHNVRDKMAMSLGGPQYPAIDAPFQGIPQGSRH